MRSRPDFNTNLEVGVGLRPAHFEDVLSGKAEGTAVSWFEVISENFLGVGGQAGGRPLWVLDRVRERFPVVMHGVSLSIGSVDPIDLEYLARLRRLAQRARPAWVSDHLCWTGSGGENLHDLLPIPYTEEALDHVVARVRAVQGYLGRAIALENVSSYVEHPDSEMPEWEFVAEVAKRADCAVLLDVNNVYVSAVNHQFDPWEYLEALPRDRVVQFHVAGHAEERDDRGRLLIDTHDHPVADAVWELFEGALERFGRLPTLVEWDDRLPTFAELAAEARKAAQRTQEALEKIGHRRPFHGNPARHPGTPQVADHAR